MSHLGATLAHFERSWDHLEAILGPSWPILAPSWPILGPSWPILEPPWLILEASWPILEASWSHLGPSWRHLGAILGPKPLQEQKNIVKYESKSTSRSPRLHGTHPRWTLTRILQCFLHLRKPSRTLACGGGGGGKRGSGGGKTREGGRG